MAYITNTKISLENITNTNIPSTDALPIDLKKLKGNTIQNTLSGKNICPTNFNDWESGQYQTNGSKQDNPSRVRVKELIKINPSTSYYFNTFTSNDRFIIRTYNNSKSFVRSIGAVVNGNIVTTNSDEYYFGISLYSNTSQTRSYEIYQELFENETIKPLICLDSETDKSYERYCGGAPSPNPNYPQDIVNVTGNQEVNISGKNLLDVLSSTTVTTTDGVTNTINSDGSITVNGTPTSETHNIINKLDFSGSLEIGTYTFSISKTLPSNIRLRVWFEDETYTDIIIGKNYLSTTYTSAKKITSWRLWLSGITTGTAINETFYIQFEKNSTATQYEPYIDKSYEINLGKNLFNFDAWTNTASGLTSIISGTNLKITGTASSTQKYVTNYITNIFKSGTYTFSIEHTLEKPLILRFYDDNNTTIRSASVSANSLSTTFTLDGTETKYRLIFNPDNGSTYNIDVNLQLEKGSQATPYSPYKTPIELCKIGDYQDYIRKSTGKNLLEGLELGQINSNTGDETPSTTYVRSTNYIPYNTNDTYYPSINGSTNYSALNGRFYNKDKEYIGYANISFSGMHNVTITKATSVQDDTPKYFRFHTSLNNISSVNENLMISTSSDKTYEPYGINWYIHKEIGKVVLNGNETNWAINGTGTVNYFYRRTFTPLMKTGGLSALSSHYPYTGIYTSNTNQGFYISAPEGSSQIRIRYGTEDTLDNFKTWLSNNNVTIYYVLATSTDTIIEDEELIAQLEALSKAYTIRPTTNIEQTSSLPFYIDLDVYSGENTYRDVIYSQEDVNSCKLYFNNVELQDADNYLEKVTFTKRVLPENGKKIFTLDNFIAEEVEIIIHDIDTSIIQDKVRIELGTLVNNTYEYVPMGVYNIQDIPTRNDNKITIKLRDNACLFDFNYNAKPLIDSLGGSATKMQILQDICNQANVNCNVNSFMGDSDFIGIYDNTIKARMYVAYIAEQAGCIAKIDRYGNLIFIPLNNLYTHRIPLNIVSKYVKGTPFKIERVVYELGTIKFETSNDETLQTLYISSANPYISVQNDIDRIFEIVENLELDSVEIQKEIIGNPAIDGYDLIEIYDDEDINKPVLFKTLANNTLIYNGKFKSKYKTEIGLEERTENVSKNSNETFKKTIKNEIDLVNGKITQTVEEISTLDDTINGQPTYIITTDTTFQADKPYYKLADNDYVLLVEGTDYQDGDLISSVGYDVYDVIYVDSMMDTVNNNIQNQIQSAIQTVQSTILEQTSEKFTMWFEQTGVQQLLDETNNLATANSSDIETIKAYIDYGTVPSGEPYAGSPYIELGKENSQTKLRILDNRIQFLTNGVETAYISNNTLYINESTILTKQVIGNNNGQWITDVDSQGNLNTYWGG